MPPAVRLALIRGWFTGRTLDVVRIPEQGEVEAYIPETQDSVEVYRAQGWVGFPGTVALTDRVQFGERVSVNRRSRVEFASFAGCRFPPDVILLAVRWYLR